MMVLFGLFPFLCDSFVLYEIFRLFVFPRVSGAGSILLLRTAKICSGTGPEGDDVVATTSSKFETGILPIWKSNGFNSYFEHIFCIKSLFSSINFLYCSISDTALFIASIASFFSVTGETIRLSFRGEVILLSFRGEVILFSFRGETGLLSFRGETGLFSVLAVIKSSFGCRVCVFSSEVLERSLVLEWNSVKYLRDFDLLTRCILFSPFFFFLSSFSSASLLPLLASFFFFRLPSLLRDLSVFGDFFVFLLVSSSESSDDVRSITSSSGM